MLLLYLFLLFTLGPMLELLVFYYISTNTSWLFALGVVVLTGIVGAALARWQGVKALMRIQRRMGRGQLPGDELFDSMLILIAGVLLVTPGFITDGVGFLLLIPPARAVIKRLLKRWAKHHVQVRTSRATDQFWSSVQEPTSPSGDSDVIDGEVVETRVVD